MKSPLFQLVATVALALTSTFATAQTSPTTPPQVFPSYNADLKGYNYPYPVQTYNFASQGKQLHMAYMHLQGRPAKPTVVLLHGKNFNGAYWKTTAEFLHKQGYGVIMPDQIGFGKSSKPKDYQYSFAALATHTHGLISSLGISKTVVVGHSMGGMVATRYALLFPEATQKLVLVNPIGLENYLVHQNYKDVAASYAAELKQTPQGVIAYQQKHYYDGNWKPEYEDLTQPLLGWVNGPDWKDLAYVAALTTDMVLTQPVVEDIKDLTVPTTLILGTRDRTAPGKPNQKAGDTYELGRYDRLGVTTKARNKNIKLTELRGLGHLPQVEDFTLYSRALLNAIPR